MIKRNILHLHSGASVLSNSKQKINSFVEAIGGFKTNDVYYGDTYSLYIENRHWNKLDELGLMGKDKLHGKKEC